MKQHICENCGERLIQEGENYRCPYCGAIYEAINEPTVQEYLEEERLVSLATRKRILFDASHQEHLSQEAILKAVNDVLLLDDQDVLANFYKNFYGRDIASYNGYLLGLVTNKAIAREVMRFSLLHFEEPYGAALSLFAENHFEGEELSSYLTAIEKETEVVAKGTYFTSLPRDIFLAYSSFDQEAALELVSFLEDNGYTCFISCRNLRHGADAVENYLNSLKDALKHCKTFLFLSSEHSRQLSCDALKIELPFVRDNLPEMKRIEYVIEEYGANTKLAARTLLKDFFFGLSYVRSKEALIERLIENSKKNKEPSCPSCGKPYEEGARYCPSCGYDFLLKKEAANPKKDLGNAPKEDSANKDEGVGFKKLFKSIIGIAQDKIDAVTNKERTQAQPSPQKEEPSKPRPSDPSDFVIKAGVLVAYKGSGGDVVVPSGVTSIGVNCFRRNRMVENVDLPSSLCRIEATSFADCPNLKVITGGLPNLVYIGERAFYGSKNLSSIALTNEHLQIDSCAFGNCFLHLALPFKAKGFFHQNGLKSDALKGFKGTANYSDGKPCKH